MSLEVLVDNDTLLQGLERKANELPEQLRELTNTAAFAVDKAVKEEVPVITGNLQGSISIDNVSDYVKRIYPDEGIAPYAIYVLKGVRGKATVDENPFMDRGFQRAEPEIQSAVDEFKSWLLGD